VLISRILRLFTTSDTAVVATIPFPIDLYDECDNPDEHPRFEEESRRVRNIWESLGSHSPPPRSSWTRGHPAPGMRLYGETEHSFSRSDPPAGRHRHLST
jgi:hypothetical protein